MPEPVANVVFDMGGVILSWNPRELIAEVMRDPVLCAKVEADIIGQPDWQSLDRGTLDRAEAVERFSQRTGIDPALTEKLLDAVPESLVPIEDTLRLIRRIKDLGTPVYLLSNVGQWTLDRLREKYDFWDLFDGLIFSCEVRMLKPEEEIYRYMLHTFGLEAANTVFIDDLPINTRAAEQVGMRTVTFRDPNQCTAALAEMGLFPRDSVGTPAGRAEERVNVKVRKPRKGDAGGIARVHVDAWRTAYQGIIPDSFLDALNYDRMERFAAERLQSEHVTGLVAAASGKGIVGYISGGIERSGDEKFGGEIYAVYVAPAHHNLAIGSRLVGALVEELQDSDIYSLMVWVLRDNPWRRFFEHLKGEVIRERCIEIGGKSLPEVAYGWRNSRLLLKEIEGRKVSRKGKR